MFVDKKSPIPAYFQLKNILLDKIKSGEYPAGSLIPSERELSETLGISRMTVRQAINLLAGEKFLVRQKGRGTFVNELKFEQKNIMSFSETVRKLGMVPGTKVLELSKETGCFDIKELLEISPKQSIFRIKRLRLADQMPIGVEEVFIPENICPGIDRLDLTKSLYKLLKTNYAIDISYIDNTIEAVKVDRENRELLKLTSGVPVLKISGINYTHAGEKLFYERDIYRADKYNYSARIYMNND